MAQYNMQHVHEAQLVFEQIAFGIFKVVKDREVIYGEGAHVTLNTVVRDLDEVEKVVLTYKDLTRPFYANFEVEEK